MSVLLTLCGDCVSFASGPAQFLTCPMDIQQSESWFVDLWNNCIVPYLVQVVKDTSGRVSDSTLTSYLIDPFILHI